MNFGHFYENSNYSASNPFVSGLIGISMSTGGNYSKKVRDALDMTQLDPNWCLPSKMDDNPLAWMIEVDGFILDARSLPLDIQEIAYVKGLIPYIPGKKDE